MTLALLQTESITRKLLKTPPPERRALALRYNVGEDFPTECQELNEALTIPNMMWRKVKLALTKVTRGVCKWWLGTRYQGHTRNNGVVKCTCLDRPTLTQTHVIHCERFANCYLETAREKETTVEEIKHKLAERDFDRDTREEIEELNDLEACLSQKITTLIGRHEDRITVPIMPAS